MEESRQLRSLGIEICPTCSVPHFPFCHPRPPSLVSNGIGGNTMIHRHPMELIHPYPFQDRVFPTYHGPPPMLRPPLFQPSPKHYLVPDEVGNDSFHKRVRVDDGPVGNWDWDGVQTDRCNDSVNTGRSDEDNERRLNLIRQHGQQRDQKNVLVGYGYPSSSNRENFVQNPVDASNMLLVRNIASKEKTSFSESEQAHASAQTTVTPDNERVVTESSKGQIVNLLHLESDRLVQQSPDNSWQSGSQHHIHEKYYGLRSRHQYLPPGMPISHSGSYQVPSPYSLPLDMESYKHGYPRYPYSVRKAGENMHHFPSQGYPIAENSWNQRSYNENQSFPVSGRNNLAISVSGQVGTIAYSHSMPSYQITSPLTKPYPVNHQQDIISTMPHQKPAQKILNENSSSIKAFMPEKPSIVDASLIFKKPHRMTRPDHITVILRGLPGSGKSYLAKLLRDLEVENGGSAPRIHSMDDYYMMEVEKVEDVDVPKSSSLVRGKKQITKMVMEYCYEPEMEEVYRSSMLKSFKKTVEDGIFSFVIVDDRNLRVADFAQFWAIGKNSGYEVYLLEATYKDPIGCAARNVHGFTIDFIQKMAEKWEETPSLYLQLDIQRLYHGDDFSEHTIQEVDMDMDDPVFDENNTSLVQNSTAEEATNRSSEGEFEVPEESTAVKDLGNSKWLKNSDDEIDSKSKSKTEAYQCTSALTKHVKSYGWSKKSVHWSDQVEKRGFSIGASKHPSVSSLLIGPGAGYNLKTNPLSEEVDNTNHVLKSRTKTDSTFLDHLREERESFKAVFDKRRQRIGGLYNAVDDD